MNAYVTGSSALYYWRRDPSCKDALGRWAQNPLIDCPREAMDLYSLELNSGKFGPMPVRLMSPSMEQRVAHNTFRYSVHSAPLPRKAFCDVTLNIRVASPELCLLEAAKKLGLFQLMELCMEMCGYYSLVSEAPRGFIAREYSLTTISKIEEFIRLSPREPGAQKLLRAIKCVQDGSRSPMETRNYLFACLPKRYGGYGIPKADLNARVDLTLQEQKYTRRAYLECDMLWPAKQVVAEYDGHEDHESRDSRAQDAAKRNVLISRGYTVFTITGRQICNVFEYDRIMRDIAQGLGYRLREFPSDWEARRLNLRKELFKSMSAYESARFF